MCLVVFFQAEDGIRDLVRSRGLGDVYKRQILRFDPKTLVQSTEKVIELPEMTKNFNSEGVVDLSLIHI